MLLPLIFFFFFKNKLNSNLACITPIANMKQSPVTIVDKRLYAEFSRSHPNNIVIFWNNMNGNSGFVFVLDDDSKEKLFASGKSGSSEAAWIQNEKVYEFHFYEDKEKLKPITQIVLTKTEDNLKQTKLGIK